jgi:hypothetical protein
MPFENKFYVRRFAYRWGNRVTNARGKTVDDRRNTIRLIRMKIKTPTFIHHSRYSRMFESVDLSCWRNAMSS